MKTFKKFKGTESEYTTLMKQIKSDGLEKILIRLIDQVTLGDGEPLTDTEVAYKAMAISKLTNLIEAKERAARVDELKKLFYDLYSTNPHFNNGKLYKIFLGEDGEGIYEIIDDRLKRLSQKGQDKVDG